MIIKYSFKVGGKKVIGAFKQEEACFSLGVIQSKGMYYLKNNKGFYFETHSEKLRDLAFSAFLEVVVTKDPQTVAGIIDFLVIGSLESIQETSEETENADNNRNEVHHRGRVHNSL